MCSCESFAFGVVESLKAGRAGGFGVGCDCKGHAVIFFYPGGRIGAESRPLLTMLLRAWREKDAPCFSTDKSSRVAFHKFCPWSTGDPMAGYVTCSFPNYLRDHVLNQTVLPLCHIATKQGDMPAFLDYEATKISSPIPESSSSPRQ